MNIVTIITLAVFGAYALHIGLIPSISDSYRTTDKRIYHGFFALASLLIWFQHYYNYKPVVKELFILAGFFLFMVSVAASFWKEKEKIIHPIVTYTAIIVGMSCVVIQFWFSWMAIVPVVVLIGGAVLLRKVKNATLWIEYLTVLCIFIPLIPKP